VVNSDDISVQIMLRSHLDRHEGEVLCCCGVLLGGVRGSRGGVYCVLHGDVRKDTFILEPNVGGHYHFRWDLGESLGITPSLECQHSSRPFV
jgi:hypothetical protein